MKKELASCLKGAKADLSEELHLQGKLEKRGKNTKVKERLPSTQESNKISWGKKNPLSSLCWMYPIRFLPEKGKFNTEMWEKVEESAKQAQVGSCKEKFTFPWDQKT